MAVCGIKIKGGAWLKAAELTLESTGYFDGFTTYDPDRVAGETYSTSVMRYGKYNYTGVGQEYLAFDIKQRIDSGNWDQGAPGDPNRLTLLQLKDNTRIYIEQLDGNRFGLRFGKYGSTYSNTNVLVFGSIPYNQLRYLAVVPFVFKNYILNNDTTKPKCGLWFFTANTPMTTGGQLKFSTFFDFLDALDTDMELKTNYEPDLSAFETGQYCNIPLSKAGIDIPGYINGISFGCVLLGESYYRNYQDVTLDIGTSTTNNIADASVTLRPNSYTYDGTAKTPVIRAVMPSGAELIDGVDYVATYHNNIEVGTAYVQMVARGSTYVGTKRVYFTIYPENTGGGGNPNIPPSGPGGGGGDGPGPSDPVPEPDDLTLSSADTGFTRIYNPTLAELQDFAYYMWTDSTILSTVWNHIKQYFEDPMDAFIALNILPVQVPNSENAEMVRLLFINTGKYMHTATNQFVTVECGSVNLTEAYKSALDYSPNTKIDLFLPYIGTVGIDADEVMNKTVTITYKVDICTGTCVAIVKVNGVDANGDAITIPLYQFSGNCAIRIPFTAANMDGYINAGLSAAKLAAGAIAGGAIGAAAGAAASAPNMAETTASAAAVSEHQMNFANPTVSGEVHQARQASASKAAKYNHAATAMRAVSAGLGIRASAKPGFAHTSGFTGNAGYMSYKTPYFIMKIPRLVNPNEFGKYNGYPSLMFQHFSDLSGYTEVQQVQLNNINATANELDEIQSLLKTGVIM